MEKLIYLQWRGREESLARFSAGLLTRTIPALKATGAISIRLNLRDEEAAAAMGNLFPGVEGRALQPDAVVHLWVDSAIDPFRAGFDAALATDGRRLAAYLVTESQPIRPMPPPASGQRMPGFAQLAFLQRPVALSQERWLEIWLGTHTPNAVTMHNSRSYVQNIVVRPLTPGAPRLDALVEEEFPHEAIEDPRQLYRAGEDEALYLEQKARLMESAARVVDFDKVDVVVTAAYTWPPEPPAL